MSFLFTFIEDWCRAGVQELRYSVETEVSGTRPLRKLQSLTAIRLMMMMMVVMMGDVFALYWQ